VRSQIASGLPCPPSPAKNGSQKLLKSGGQSASALSRAHGNRPRHFDGKMLDLRRGNAKCAEVLGRKRLKLPKSLLVPVCLNPIADRRAHRCSPYLGVPYRTLTNYPLTISAAFLALLDVVSPVAKRCVESPGMNAHVGFVLKIRSSEGCSFRRRL
jgi:hypothetical protein